MQCPKCGSPLELFKQQKYVCSNAACDFAISKAEADRQDAIQTPVVESARHRVFGNADAKSDTPGVLTDNRGGYRGKRLLSLIPKLPSTLAIMLDEYIREENDYIALHAMCAALEITARFLTIVTLADVWRRIPPGGDFSEKLIEQLCRSLTQPTLGAWRFLLTAAVSALPDREKRKECLLPVLPGYVDKFVGALGGGKESPEEKFLSMRNLLAHGGRISDEQVARFRQRHAPRFEELMRGLAFFAEEQGVKLIASPATGPARWLRGLPETWEDFNRAHLPEYFQPAGPERMLLVTPDGVLDLFPLHAYGEVFHLEKSTLVGKGEEAIHIFSRREQPNGVTYTALGSRETHSRGQPTWEDRFADIFKLEAWRARMYVEGALKHYTFTRRMDELLELFIGRDEQVQAAVRRIAATENGILWLGGKPGMGKSAFMAKLVRDYYSPPGRGQGWVTDESASHQDVISIPYFFQLADGDKCRTTAFLEAALLHLQQARQHVEIDPDPQKRVVQFKTVLRDFAGTSEHQKLIFFVDGLDEIAGIDAEFVNLVFACQFPGVVWVCAGRDEDLLRQRFNRTSFPSRDGQGSVHTPVVRQDTGCVSEQQQTPGVAATTGVCATEVGWFFECDSAFDALRVERKEDEGLLPSLKEENARGFLIEELGHQLKALFKRDKQQKNGVWTNEFLAALIRRSEGLPLYLRHLVQDVRAGRFDFTPGSEQKLPQGLTAYYDRIVEEMGDDLKATVPAITSLLAVAKEPLPVETLAVLLADHELVGQADGRELLDEALRHSSSMLRQAPTAAGSLGYTLYHTSFKQHLLHSDQVRHSRAKARDRLCQLAITWRDHQRDSLPRDYAFRFGPAHLIEEGKWEAVETLLTDLYFIEAKCAAGMTYDLIADYAAALDNLPDPDAQQERQEKQAVQKYIKDLIAYVEVENIKNLLAYFKGEIKEPENIKSVEPWTDEQINADSERIKNNPTRLNRIRAFAQFVNAENYALVKFAAHPGFVIQHAYNSANAGPVHQSAEPLVEYSTVHVLLLDVPANLPDYTPHPALLQTLEGHISWVDSVSLTLDGRYAVSGSSDDTVRVWDLATGKCLHTLTGHRGIVHSVSVTPDGQRAVSGSEDRTVRVWDLATGECLRTLTGHTDTVRSVSVTLDGRRAVSGSSDDTVRVWDLATGECLRTLTGHTDTVRSVSVTPDGRCAMSGSWDHTLRVWDLATGECLDLYHTLAPISSISAISANGHVGYGTSTGKVRFLTLRNLPLDSPFVTPIRIWLSGANDQPGQWDNHLTTVCPWCGQRFDVDAKLLDVINSITSVVKLALDQSPCLDLPAAAWNDPRLHSACPNCRKPLRFSPFIHDNQASQRLHDQKMAGTLRRLLSSYVCLLVLLIVNISFFLHSEGWVWLGGFPIIVYGLERFCFSEFRQLFGLELMLWVITLVTEIFLWHFRILAGIGPLRTLILIWAFIIIGFPFAVCGMVKLGSALFKLLTAYRKYKQILKNETTDPC